MKAGLTLWGAKELRTGGYSLLSGCYEVKIATKFRVSAEPPVHESMLI